MLGKYAFYLFFFYRNIVWGAAEQREIVIKMIALDLYTQKNISSETGNQEKLKAEFLKIIISSGAPQRMAFSLKSGFFRYKKKQNKRSKPKKIIL